MLPRELKRRADERARRRGVSLGELVRESLTAYLTEPASAQDSLLSDRAVCRRRAPKDLAADHDRYLYDE